MSILLKKPKHKKEVIATDRGWEVEETGELLTSRKNLKTDLDALETEKKKPVSKPVKESKTVSKVKKPKDSITTVTNEEND